MNTYIWQGVMCDYTCGMAVAIAETKKEAVNSFEELYVRTALKGKTPIVIPADTTITQGYYVCGGG